MKALTISQPYASLIASGEKWIENRTWYTSYRGPIAIHAGKGTQYLSRKELAEVPHSCIVATATLTECVRLREVAEMYLKPPAVRDGLMRKSRKRWSEVIEHPHAEGPFCWILCDIVALDPVIPFKGAQGLWEWNQ